MPSDKLRLYLALYARLKDPKTYHYALHVSPKRESADRDGLEATKYHCKNIIQTSDDTVAIAWTYEAANINPNNDSRLLIRVLLGKIRRPSKLEHSLENVVVKQNDPDFNCIE